MRTHLWFTRVILVALAIACGNQPTEVVPDPPGPKTELVYLDRYRTREEARFAIFDYIAAVYKRIRRHSSIGYQSPEEHEAAYTVA